MSGGPAEVIAPAYGSGSLGEVLPSAFAALGSSEWDNVLGLPSATSYVVLLVDGMGWNLLRRHAAEAPYLGPLADRGRAITCGVPSTTATSLTSLGAGRAPGSHGVVGFTSRIPGTGRLLDALHWNSEVDPQVWQPHATVFESASRAGITASVVTHRAFERSGLTGAAQRGATFLGADRAGERIAATVSCAAVPRSVTYVYVGELDSVGHRSGCESSAWRYQLAVVDGFARLLRSALSGETALVVVADHGMVDIPAGQRIDLDVEPDLRRGLTLVGGEARFRHLYCGTSAVPGVVTRWRDRLGDTALVRTRDEAIDAGWFGAVEPAVLPRLGDVVVAGLDTAVVLSERFTYESTLVGLHGSVTADEMWVPLLVDGPGSDQRV